MKKTIQILKYLCIGLSSISLLFIIYSAVTLLKQNCLIDIIKSPSLIYLALATYSGLYKFTFIVCAFWATLRQLEFSQNNYDNTLKQIKFVQDDIIDKRKRDITTDTLKQCNFYLQEIQISYKELIETNIVSGTPIDWRLLTSYTNACLKENYSDLHDRFDKIDRQTKNQLLIMLYKLETFSSLCIHGNLDMQLARSIIGNTFSNQVGFLLGPISYFRKDTTTVFGQNCIKLYNEWTTNNK